MLIKQQSCTQWLTFQNQNLCLRNSSTMGVHGPGKGKLSLLALIYIISYCGFLFSLHIFVFIIILAKESWRVYLPYFLYLRRGGGNGKIMVMEYVIKSNTQPFSKKYVSNYAEYFRDSLLEYPCRSTWKYFKSI